MSKEQKAKEYAKQYDEYDWQLVSEQAYEEGWDEALKSRLVNTSKELPEYDIDVWVINENGEQFICHRSNEDVIETDKYGWCNYSGSNIIAWIRPISFDEILESNKDVLKRLKDK